jgi:RNA polymerase sigma-70 factor (ECF subfamily)
VDDDELLRRCQQGDDAALTLLVQRFEGRIFRLAFRVLQDAARAEDATADALATVWSKCGSWRGEAAAATWIQQVAWRVVLDHHRRRKRWWRFWEGNDSDEQRADDNPAQLVSAAEEQAHRQQQLAAALAQLSAEDRALVHLHYVEEQSLAEIAQVMQVSRDALKMRLSRARQKLRAVWGENNEAQ